MYCATQSTKSQSFAGRAGDAFERHGLFQPIVADGAFGVAPHHAQLLARSKRRGNQQCRAATFVPLGSL